MAIVKQDRSRPRTPSDVERRYKLGMIEPTAEKVSELENEWVVDSFLSATSTNPVQNKIVTTGLNSKVTKEDGKGLSTNDFSNDYKSKVDNADENSHTHTNKTVLDNITSDDVTDWNNKSNLSSTVLFNNASGSNTDITLSSSVVNFDYIDIVFGDSTVIDTKRIYEANNKTISLSLFLCSTTNYIQKNEQDSISANTITRSIRNKITVDSTGTVFDNEIIDSDKLLIYKVTGYKE